MVKEAAVWGKWGRKLDTETYSVGEVERIARIAFEIANKRKRRSQALIRPISLKVQDYGVKL